MKKYIKYLLLSIGIALFIGFPWICVKLFAGVSGGGTGSSTVEGTAVLSTGETGGTKFLREDGDDTSSWQTVPGSGGDLLANGTVPLTANWDVGNFSITMRDLIADYGVAGATMSISGLATVGTIQTGQGATEVYLMDQAVQTTNAVTFDKITSTTDITAASMTLTGSGQSSLNAGLIVNEDGGANATTDAFRVETNTEAYMINTSADADTCTIGGIANGVMFSKGGAIDFIGTAAGNEIGGLHWEKSFVIISSSQTYAVGGSSICLIAKTPKAVTITNIEVTLDAAPILEFTGDLKYADTFIGLANPTVINDLDTTSGARSDSSITSGSIAAGKCLYLNYDVAPDTNTKQMAITLTGKYN